MEWFNYTKYVKDYGRFLIDVGNIDSVDKLLEYYYHTSKFNMGHVIYIKEITGSKDLSWI